MTLVNFKNQGHPVKWMNPLDAIFNDDFASMYKPAFGYFPPVNVKEGKDSFNIELAAPGRSKGDFNIKLEKNLLTISSNVENKTEETGEKWTRKEFSFASFSRTFNLPESADGANVTAEYTDGILKVAIPKKEEAKDKGTIEIKVA
jgi:HSP20 family protein